MVISSMSAPIDILIQLNRVFKTFKIMNPVKSIEPITEKDEIEKFQTLKEQVFEEYADYSLEKLYNFNELLIDTIHQLQFKQMAMQELITHRLDNICPKETTN
tara:strand:+ start:204 stop:512 length:309 start_codon:yes stop_codon:yes gene_type:complete